jgi:hypothetical protein
MSYAFEGFVIRLNQKDLDNWANLFPDTEEEFLTWLSERDDWLIEQPDRIRKGWFMSTGQMIASLKQEFERKYK